MGLSRARKAIAPLVTIREVCVKMMEQRRRSIEMLQTYEGGCHCERIRFRIRADLTPPAIGECNCSICTKKGILHITVPPENFELLRGEGEMTTYRFNTGTAQHTF